MSNHWVECSISTGYQKGRALQATRDGRQAERIAREILEAFGLLPMALDVAMEGRLAQI